MKWRLRLLTRGETVLLVIMLSVMLAIAIVSVLAATVLQPTAPVTYSADYYYPEQQSYCPGDTLVYTNTLRVHRPGLVMFGASWFVGHGDDARPAIPGDALRYSVFSQPVEIGNARRTNVVPNLPPGPAEMHFGASTFGGGSAVHVVPFWVKSGCKSGG